MTIEQIYKKGTAAQLWAAWSAEQRSHFLIDHYDMFKSDLESDVNAYAQKFQHSAWKDLPEVIRKEVSIHHAMGYYKDGGQIKKPMKYLTADKKKLQSRIASINERAGKIKDAQTLAAINDQVQKLEALLNAPKAPTQQKVAKWKESKTARRLARKMA